MEEPCGLPIACTSSFQHSSTWEFPMSSKEQGTRVKTAACPPKPLDESNAGSGRPDGCCVSRAYVGSAETASSDYVRNAKVNIVRRYGLSLSPSLRRQGIRIEPRAGRISSLHVGCACRSSPRIVTSWLRPCTFVLHGQAAFSRLALGGAGQ